MTNDEKRAIIEAATPGPWYVNNHNEILEKLMSVDENGAFVGERPNGIAEIYPLNKQANAKFIAAARTEWPKDLERLEELERENKRLREEARRAADLLEAVCGDCSDFINNIRMCISNEYCDVLSTCDNIKVLLRGKG